MRHIRNIVPLATIIMFFAVSCSYQADFSLDEILSEAGGVTLQNHNETVVINPPGETDVALVFYPGGSVEYSAYIPLLVRCAKNGIKCFLVQQPYDLAIFNISAAGKFPVDYPEIKKWYIGGHSLGGAMASTYVSKHPSDFSGLVLLAAYSTSDLSKTGVRVLSLYGSRDGVLKMDNYRKNIANLPEDFEEHVIEGGNHGNFGCYGFQKGDNEASITASDQQTIAANYIKGFCK